MIITVTKVEAQAVLEVFSQAAGHKWTRQTIGNKTYYHLGIHGSIPTLMVQSEMGSATPGGALLTVRQAINDLHPQAIIMCGIAFGLRPDRQQVGDILIAKQLHYYEPQKVDLQQGQIPRGDRVTSSERLLDRFRSGDNEWQGAKTHFGLVLSGEKLINDPVFRDWLLESEREAIGGEMEGAGLYAAARDAKVDWILVKAICDWADGEKQNNEQPTAARNAAKFVLHVIRLGGWGGIEQLQEQNYKNEIRPRQETIPDLPGGRISSFQVSNIKAEPEEIYPLANDINNIKLLDTAKILNLLFLQNDLAKLEIIMRILRDTSQDGKQVISEKHYLKYKEEIRALEVLNIISIPVKEIPLNLGIPFHFTELGSYLANLLTVIHAETGHRIHKIKDLGWTSLQILTYLIQSRNRILQKGLLDLEFILHCESIVSESLKADKLFLKENADLYYKKIFSDTSLQKLGNITKLSTIDRSVFETDFKSKINVLENVTLTCSTSMYAFICMVYICEEILEREFNGFTFYKKYNSLSKDTLTNLVSSLQSNNFELYAMADWEVKKLFQLKSYRENFIILMNLPNQLHRVARVGTVKNSILRKIILSLDTTAEGGFLRLQHRDDHLQAEHHDVIGINKFVQAKEGALIMWEPFASIFAKNFNYKLLPKPIPHSAYLIAHKEQYYQRVDQYHYIIGNLNRAWTILENDKSVVHRKVIYDKNLLSQVNRLFSIMGNFA